MSTYQHYLSWLIALVLLAFMGGVPGPAASQDQTATPALNYLESWRTYMLFPEAIVLQTDVRLAPEVDIIAALLTLNLPNRSEPIRISIDLTDEDIVTRNSLNVGLEHVWRVPAASDAPIVFEPVVYRWDISYSDGTFDTLTEEITFQDHRISWLEDTGDETPLRLLIPASGPSPSSIFAALRPISEKLSAEATLPENVIDVVLYTEGHTPGCSLGENDSPIVENPAYTAPPLPCTPGKALEIYQQDGYVVYDLQTDLVSTSRRTLVPLLVDTAYAPYWEGNDVPAWFQAGIKTLYDIPSEKIRLLSPALVATRNNQLFALDDMETVPEQASDAYDRWTAQSYGMVVYIAERHGLPALFELARSTENGADFEQNYEDITGESIESLVALWSTWVFSDEAPATYGVDLYGPPTLTPTPILTDTPRPPSRTPLPTATATRTPTATNTSPPATSTPTVTPRAARDVFTATPPPTAVPSPAPLAQQQALRWGFAGLIVVALGIIGIALIAGRRP